MAREFGDRACHLDARLSAADDHEGEQRGARLLACHSFSPLEGEEDFLPQPRRIGDGLYTGRILFPALPAEITMARARSDHQVIPRNGAAAFGMHDARLTVDAGDSVEQDARVFLAAQDVADRPGDIGRRQRRRRNLVQKRLEQMVVVAVDHSDVCSKTREGLHRRKPAKPCADNDNARICGDRIPARCRLFRIALLLRCSAHAARLPLPCLAILSATPRRDKHDPAHGGCGLSGSYRFGLGERISCTSLTRFKWSGS